MPRAFAPRAHAARKAVAPRDPAADGWLHKLGAFVKLLQEVFKFASPVVISRSWEGFLLWQVWPALCGWPPYAHLTCSASGAYATFVLVASVVCISVTRGHRLSGVSAMVSGMLSGWALMYAELHCRAELYAAMDMPQTWAEVIFAAGCTLVVCGIVLFGGLLRQRLEAKEAKEKISETTQHLSPRSRVQTPSRPSSVRVVGASILGGARRTLELLTSANTCLAVVLAAAWEKMLQQTVCAWRNESYQAEYLRHRSLGSDALPNPAKLELIWAFALYVISTMIAHRTGATLKEHQRMVRLERLVIFLQRRWRARRDRLLEEAMDTDNTVGADALAQNRHEREVRDLAHVQQDLQALLSPGVEQPPEVEIAVTPEATASTLPARASLARRLSSQVAAGSRRASTAMRRSLAKAQAAPLDAAVLNGLISRALGFNVGWAWYSAVSLLFRFGLDDAPLLHDDSSHLTAAGDFLLATFITALSLVSMVLVGHLQNIGRGTVGQLGGSRSDAERLYVTTTLALIVGWGWSDSYRKIYRVLLDVLITDDLSSNNQTQWLIIAWFLGSSAVTWVVLLIHRRALLTRISVEFEEDEQGKRRTHTWELDEPRMQHSGRWLQLKATLLCGRVVIIEGLNLAAPLAGQISSGRVLRAVLVPEPEQSQLHQPEAVPTPVSSVRKVSLLSEFSSVTLDDDAVAVPTTGSGQPMPPAGPPRRPSAFWQSMGLDGPRASHSQLPRELL